MCFIGIIIVQLVFGQCCTMRPPALLANFIFMSDQNSSLIFACLLSQIFWSKRVRGNAGYLNSSSPTVRDDFYDLKSHKVSV